MSESTKIIPFPSRARPLLLPSRSPVVEFAELSEFIWRERSPHHVRRLVLPAVAVDIEFPRQPN